MKKSKKEQLIDCKLYTDTGSYLVEANHPSTSNVRFWIGLLLVQAALLVCLSCLLSVGHLGPLPQAQQVEDDNSWGASVLINGHSVPVISWFDNQLKPNNVKNNLQ